LSDDYLKYWRVIRQYVKAKYKISQAQLDMLLFLKSEDYFSKDKFDEFDKLLSWNEHRFKKLLRDGWIEVFRKRKGRRKGLYTLSFKSKHLVASIYKKLSGEEIPTTPSHNPMFLKNVSYTDKRYRDAIIAMNEFIRQQRHHAPE
jgi:DNA-binding MarR family transcriptional regulator